MARVPVTDGAERSALVVVRSLGRAGHQVAVAASLNRCLAAASRWCRHELRPSWPPKKFACCTAHRRPPRRPRAPVAALARLGTRAPGAGVRVVKSVHGALSPEWVARASGADRVLVVMRSPYAVLQSMKNLRMPDAIRAGCLTPRVLADVFGAGRVEGLARAGGMSAMAVQLAAQYVCMERAASAGGARWRVVTHEALCGDPVGTFKGLITWCGLLWTTQVEYGIRSRNREGHGYRAIRVASKEIGKWRRGMPREEAADITISLQAAGLEKWCEEF